MTTPSTTNFRRGDVVLLPFQFTDKPVAKLRPALIISADIYHAARQEVVIAAITSRIRDPLLFGDHKLARWEDAGLPKPSVVTAIFRTVKRGLLVRVLGVLQTDDLKAVNGLMAASFDLR